MNWREVANLKRAADLLDEEAESWKQGFAAYINGAWRFNGEYPEQELRVMRLESAAKQLRKTAGREARSLPADYQI